MTFAEELTAGGEELPRIARWSVEMALRGDYVRPPRATGGLLAERRGVFVTIWEGAKKLRGCIGSLEPRCATVIEETWRVAREAAFGDSRFSPITSAELASLFFKVSVLHPLQPVSAEADLDPARYGVVVRTPDGRRGALLPALPEVGTAVEQLRLARQKGGIAPSEQVRIERFAVEVFLEG